MYQGMRAHAYIYIIKIAVGGLGSVLLHGQLLHFSFRQCPAAAGQRTKQTVGRLRRTLHGSEVHNCLVIICRPGFIEHLTRQSGKSLFPFSRINGNINAEIAGKHPIHIPVDRRIRHVIGKGADGRCRIIPHSLQSTYLCIGFRKCPLHAFGCGMQVTGTRIVPQALPIFHHFVLGRSSQRHHIREAFYETQKILIPLRHSCLL